MSPTESKNKTGSKYIKATLLDFEFLILMAFKNLAMYYAENPAYASAIILLSPIWIIVWNNLRAHFKGKKTGYSHVSFKLIGLLLFSVITLVVLSH